MEERDPTHAVAGEREPRRGSVAQPWARRLDQHGGVVLVAIGSALIGFAIWKSDRAAVAPLLIVFGAGMIVLGAFYARIEGNIEATRDGVKAVVREVERLAADENLSRVDFVELVSLALDRYEPPRGRPSEVLPAARRAAQEAVRDPAESPVALERRLAHATTTWLESDGWSVVAQGRDFGYDPARS